MELFLPPEVETFLESIWRRFGHHSPEIISRIAKETLAYRQAYKKAKGTEITIEAMRLSFSRAEEAPPLDQVIRPKILRSQSGKPVTVKAWVPGAKQAGGK